MKRAWLSALGILLLLVGLALAAAGLFVAATLGADDAVSTAPARVQGSGVAVVAEDVRVDEGGLPVPEGVGSLTLIVRARDGREMFAGVAAPADLDTYLTGAPYDVVVDLSAGSTATTRAVPGTQQPPPPDSVRFWTASSRGAPATLAARVPAGSTLVVMNADARPGVDADVVVTLRVPHAWQYAWVAVGVGVLVVVLAVVAFWRARVAGHRPPAPTGLVPAADLFAATVLPSEVPEPSPQQVEDHPGPRPVVDIVAAGVVVAPQVGAAGDAADSDDAGLVDDADPEPGESDPADADTVAEERPRPGGASAEPGSRAEPATGPADEPVAAPDAETDPVFAELVSAYGLDPVHDALPVTGEAGRPDAAPAEPGPPGPPPHG